MGKITFNDGPYKTFVAHTPADLIGKEDHLVEMRSDGTIQLLASGIAIGVLHQHLEGDDGAWNVRLLGKGGTVRVIQDGAIAPGTLAKGKAGGRVEAIGASGRSIGIKVDPADAGAANDVIEIVDVVENIAAG